MLVKGICENAKERRIFRGEVCEKAELCSDLCRVLLKDTADDLVYCLLQGGYWVSRAGLMNIGEKVLIGPYRVAQVPQEYSDFYAPSVPGQRVSGFYIHLGLNDSDFRIEQEKSGSPRPALQHFRELSECHDIASANTLYRVSVVGVIVDYVFEDKRPKDTLTKMKIIDGSTQNYIQLHLFTSFENRPEINGIGDIVVAHGVTFRHFHGKPQGTYNKLSGGLCTFSSVDASVAWSTHSFDLNSEIIERVCRLQNWVLEHAGSTDFSTGRTLPNLGHKKQHRFQHADFICFVVENIENFPEHNHSLLILCDDTGYTKLQTLTCNVRTVPSGGWVKLREVKILENSLQLGKHSSVVPIPEWALNVQGHLQDTIPGLEAMKEQARRWVRGLCREVNAQKERIVTSGLLEEQRLTGSGQVLNPLSGGEYVRVRGLGLDLQPRDIERGLLWGTTGWEFQGLLYVWSEGALLEVILSGAESGYFFSLDPTEGRALAVSRIVHGRELLFEGNNWLELCLKRTLHQGGVYLKLTATSLNSYI